MKESWKELKRRLLAEGWSEEPMAERGLKPFKEWDPQLNTMRDVNGKEFPLFAAREITFGEDNDPNQTTMGYICCYVRDDRLLITWASFQKNEITEILACDIEPNTDVFWLCKQTCNYLEMEDDEITALIEQAGREGMIKYLWGRNKKANPGIHF